jgi:hypothetical protein
VRLAEITDGTSNTVLIGEKALDPAVCQTGSWYYDEPFYTGGSEGTTRLGFLVLKDRPGALINSNWGSAHTSTAEFVFADGSIRGIPHGTDWVLVYHALTPSAGDASPDF